MAVRTLEIGHKLLSSTSDNGALFTVPAGKTLIIKEISVSNTSPSSVGGVSMHVQTAGGLSRRVYDRREIAANTHDREERFLVLEPGDSINVSYRAGTPVVYLSGALLDGVAQ